MRNRREKLRPRISWQVAGHSLSSDKFIFNECFIKGTTPSPDEGSGSGDGSGDGSGGGGCDPGNPTDPEYWVMSVDWSYAQDHPMEIWGPTGPGIF